MNILVIPDAQVKPGVPTRHLKALSRYIARKRPQVVVNIGDFADMPSLSSYDRGKRSFEGRRYHKDVDSVKEAMDLLLGDVRRVKGYGPRLVMCLGNHEQRIVRATEDNPVLESTISLGDLGYEDAGWEVCPFLDIVDIEGVAFSHYFTSGDMGRPVSSARAMLSKVHQSCIMGHRQTADVAFGTYADGRHMTGIHTGGFYLHQEGYLGPQGNKHWRGVWMLHGVKKGSFGHNMVSMDFLLREYL